MRHLAAGLAIVTGVAAAGCGRHEAEPSAETKRAALKAQQIALARNAGTLPSLTTPYASLELFDDPVSVASTAPPCVSGGDINNDGKVVGWDCRSQPQWYGGTGYLPGVIAEPSAPGLSSSVVNHAATLTLPSVAGSQALMPTAINKNGDITANTYLNATGKWTSAFFRGASHAPRALTNMPSSFSIYGMTDDADPLLAGGLTPTGSTLSSWFKYQVTATPSTEAPTILPRPPGSVYTNGSVYAVNTHHGSSHDLVGFFSKTDGTSTAMVYDETNTASPWLDLSNQPSGIAPFMRLEQARDVNNSRWVVGYGMTQGSSTSAWYRHPFLTDLTSGKTIDLGTFVGMNYPGQDYVAYSINSLGHVVGSVLGSTSSYNNPAYTPYVAWIWTRQLGIRKLSDFIDPALGVTLVSALRINDKDEIMGLATIPGQGYRLFRLKLDLGPTFFEPTDGKACSNALAINNAGTVLGRSDDCAPLTGNIGPSAPWLARAAGGGPVSMAALVDGRTAYPGGINDAELAVGATFDPSESKTTAALYSGGTAMAGTANVTFTDVSNANTVAPQTIVGQDGTGAASGWFVTIGAGRVATPLPSGFSGPASALGANDVGTVVGYASQGTQKVAMAWFSDGAGGGTMTPLRSLLDTTTDWSSLDVAYAVNNAQQVVGFGTRAGQPHRAFKLSIQPGNVSATIEDLGTLEAPYGGALPYAARAISSKGWIVGAVGSAGDDHPLNAQRAFLHTKEMGMTDLNALVAVPAGWELREATGINDNDEVVGWALNAATGMKRGFKLKLPPLKNVGCVGQANGTACDDGNPCTEGDTCQDGLCASNPQCLSRNACVGVGTCDLVAGRCDYTNKQKPEGTSCSDGDACTSDDKCNAAGVCVGGAPVQVSCPTSTEQCRAAGVCDPKSRPTPAAQDLLAWWRFEGDGSDASPAGKPLLPSANAVFKGGKSGAAADFDGGTACFRAPAWPEAKMAGSALTLAAWVKIPSSFQCPSSGVARAIVGKGNDYALGIGCAGGSPRAAYSVHYANQTNYGFAYGAHNLTPDVWHHLVFTWTPKMGTASAVSTVYVDGQFDAGAYTSTANATSVSDADPNVTVGCFSAGVYWIGAPFQGAIDEVTMYKRALTGAEVTAAYAAGNAAPACKYDVAQDGATCTSGDRCTTGDTCQAGTCVKGPSVECRAKTCFAPGVCNPSSGVCEYTPLAAGASCDDHDLCTDGETCNEAHACVGPQKDCRATDVCHTDGMCDHSTGKCEMPLAPNGTLCDDHSKCTTGDQCYSGVCTGAPKRCKASDQCHSDGVCDPDSGACSDPPLPDDSPCDDQVRCTTNDVCRAGSCQGARVMCHALDTNHLEGSCDEGSGVCSNPWDPSVVPMPSNEVPVHFEYTMLKHFPGQDLPPVAETLPTPKCTNQQKGCTTADGHRGCQDFEGYDAVTSSNEHPTLGQTIINVRYGDCHRIFDEAPCAPNRIASCTTTYGTVGLQTCQLDNTWEPCRAVEWCNGIDDDGNHLIDDGDVCRLPVSVWKLDHSKGFDTWLVGSGAIPPSEGTVTQYRWSIAGRDPIPPTTYDVLPYTFPAEGDYEVTLEVTTSTGKTGRETQHVVIQNYVIASAGDSIASGEGNPDIPSPPPPANLRWSGIPAEWQSRKCHRSLNSFHALAARAIEQADPHTSVSFVSTACSGAGIRSGMVGAYAGQEPDTINEEPQLVRLNRILGGKMGSYPDLDALLMQIGANDGGFGDRAMLCALPTKYVEIERPFPFQGNFYAKDVMEEWCALEDENTAALNSQKDRYPCLAAIIQGQPVPPDCWGYLHTNDLPIDYLPMSLKVPPNRIYITDYPDPTHWVPDPVGAPFTTDLCHDGFEFKNVMEDGLREKLHHWYEVYPALISVIGAVGPDGMITGNELGWLEERTVLPLNQNVRDAAGANSWTYVPGPWYHGHGYCAGTESWIRQYTDSWRYQGNMDGVLHPNIDGHKAYAAELLKKINAELRSRPRPTCSSNDQCNTGESCQMMYEDWDGDGFGDIHHPLRQCRPPNQPKTGYSFQWGDCCDTDAGAHPGVTVGRTTPNACGEWDWNCDARVTRALGDRCLGTLYKAGSNTQVSQDSAWECGYTCVTQGPPNNNNQFPPPVSTTKQCL